MQKISRFISLPFVDCELKRLPYMLHIVLQVALYEELSLGQITGQIKEHFQHFTYRPACFADKN